VIPKRYLAGAITAALTAGAALVSGAQPAARIQGAPPYTLLTHEGRRSLVARRVNGQDMFTLDELAPIFGLSVREDALAGGLTIGAGRETIVLSAGQTLASVGGRLISLPAPPVRDGRTWLVPVELVSRAVGPATGTRVEVRKASRLVIVGPLDVPRVGVRVDEEDGERARLTFEVDPPAGHHVTEQNGRLVVTFDADAIDPRLGAVAAGPLVAAVRAADDRPAIAVDLGPAFTAYRVSDVGGGEGEARFVIALTGAAQAAPVPPAPVTPAPPGVPAPPAAPFGETPEAPAIQTIVIDPGHGGTETGVRGPNGTLEKDVTLAVARRLKSAIEGRLGIRVLLTRDGDQTAGLDERAAVANSNKADLFISLHANASPRASTAGAEVFSLSLEGYGQEAEAASSADGVTLPVFGGPPRVIQLVPWEMAQARYLDQSAALAGLVADELRQRVPMSPRALARGPFRVLVGANMPAVLVEMGFLSNPNEERVLTTEPFQNSVVEALLQSVIRFRDRLRAAATKPGGRP
jgi:N-acetylmuramoyl-L-alanine amidase